MIVKKDSRNQTKKKANLIKSSSKLPLSGILRKITILSKFSFAAMVIALVSLSSCSAIGQKVAEAADALKTDAQTAHDENFRIKRVRKALVAGDILSAEQQRNTIHSQHWRLIANIEIATAKYPFESQEALKMIETATKEIWQISDANKRATALLALLRFELETNADLSQAKEIIKQTENTIAFIIDDPALKMRRYDELQKVLAKYNYLLSK